MGAPSNGNAMNVQYLSTTIKHPLDPDIVTSPIPPASESPDPDAPFLPVPAPRSHELRSPAQDKVIATAELVENVLSWLDDRDLAGCAVVWALVRPLRAELTAGTSEQEREWFQQVAEALRHISPWVRDWAVDCVAMDLFAVWAVGVLGDNVIRLRMYNWPPRAAVWINPLLHRCPNVRLLSLSEFTDAVLLPTQLPHLHSLKIAERIPDMREFEKIASYTNLTRLFIAKLQQGQELRALGRLVGLTHLLIPYCAVDWDDGLFELLEKVGGGLEALDLSTSRLESHALTTTTVQNICVLCPHLEQLSLDDYTGTSLAAAGLLFMSLQDLKSLSMLGERINSTSFERLLLQEVVEMRSLAEVKVQFWFNSDQQDTILGCRPTADGVYADWATSYNWTMFQTSGFSHFFALALEALECFLAIPYSHVHRHSVSSINLQGE
ncbi:hypothetical protein HDU93_003540 [Gonapodya sp. JEL0774]|nr:hypothetical protein HDU93_003540 [Gonapodya sp. JEL0774]